MSLLLHNDAMGMLSAGAFLATVVTVQDPQQRNRVKVRVFNVDGATDQDGEVWARLAAPFAGQKRGAFFIPDVGDEVLVIYLSGDSRFPVIIGSLWNGTDAAPETLGGAGDSVDRWTITGKAGTRIAIVEERSSSPLIKFSTPSGLTGTLDDSSGGSIALQHENGTTVTIDTSGISLNAPTARVQITAASEVDITAPSVSVSAGKSTFSGIVQCATLIADTIVATTYTPGAGNAW